MSETTRELEEVIDRLLHDAEHAHSGAMLARRMRDPEAAKRLFEKSRRCRAQAAILDPDKAAPAWKEIEPW